MGPNGHQNGHHSQAVYRAYARRARMKIPSLEEYEREAEEKMQRDLRANALGDAIKDAKLPTSSPLPLGCEKAAQLLDEHTAPERRCGRVGWLSGRIKRTPHVLQLGPELRLGFQLLA